MFVSLCLLRVNFYIATVQGQLNDIGRSPKSKPFAVSFSLSLLTFPAVQTYTDLFALILPAAGVASVPLVGLMLDKAGLLISIFG